MTDPAFTAEQQSILNVVFRSFNGQIADLRNRIDTYLPRGLPSVV